MKTTMLDYSKIILSKVSFHPELFRKEYRKALNQLTSDESEELNAWITRNFGVHEQLGMYT